MNETGTPRLQAGDELAHYRVESAVGEGAMGTVYRAHDTSLDRTVGLKVLKPEVSRDERFVKRFVREARAAARVSHPNLTHIYFIGEQDEQHFFAMEFVDGEDLEEHVEANGPMGLDQALDVLIQTARGLRAAHRAGVVHRDVKPSNLLLQPDGEIRITDFGLAKSLDVDVDATQAGVVVGTPTYMSPEQCRGATVDHRTDVYALGLTAFYLLTGRKAFEGENLGSMIDSQLNAPLPRLPSAQDDSRDDVDAVVRRMCAKDRDDRYEDMDEVIDALEGCRRRPVPPAPLATRIMAALLDLVTVIGVASIVHLVVARITGATEGFSDSLMVTVFTAALFAAYHVVCEMRWGQTIGKWLFGIRVASSRGARPALRYVVLRLLIRYPTVATATPVFLLQSFELSLFESGLQVTAIGGAIVAYLLTRGRTLSDLLTPTRVTLVVPPTRTEYAPQETSSITQ